MHKGKLIAFAIAAAACSSTPTNFAGTYTVTVVDGADNCNLGNGWTSGNSTSNISATITQDGQVAQLTIGGLTAVYLDLVVGTATFSGSVTGDSFTSSFLGSKTQSQGACTYSLELALQISIDANNNLSGTITYTPKTNDDVSCGTLQSCSNTQTVSGARTGN